jgi:hypothetical protein
MAEEYYLWDGQTSKEELIQYLKDGEVEGEADYVADIVEDFLRDQPHVVAGDAVLPLSYSRIPTTDPMFQDRTTKIMSFGSDLAPEFTTIPIADDHVLCNGCNENQYPVGFIDAVYINGSLHDVYCAQCRVRYFSQAVEVGVS